MTRGQDHHHGLTFGLGPGHLSHRGGSSRSRTNTADSGGDSSFLSIRNLGETTDLEDDVDVVSAAVGRVVSSFRGLGSDRRGGPPDGGGGGGSGSSTPRGGGGGGGAALQHPMTPQSPLHRRMPSFDGIAGTLRGSFSPSSSMSSVSPSKRGRAWTADAVPDVGSPILQHISSRVNGKKGGGDIDLGSAALPIPPLYSPEKSSATDPSMPEKGRPAKAALPVLTALPPPAGGDAAKTSTTLPIRPVSFMSLRSAQQPEPAATMPEGMTLESASSWLASGSGSSEALDGEARSDSNAAARQEVFDDDYDGEEEKTEITAIDEEEEGLRAESFSPRSLPPRNEVYVEEEIPDDSLRGPGMWHGGGVRTPTSSRPPTIVEEPSLGATNTTHTTDGDSDVGLPTAPLPQPQDAAAASQKASTTRPAGGYYPSYEQHHGPIGASRLDSLSETERANIIKAVQWASGQSAGSLDDEYYYPDGFDDEDEPYRATKPGPAEAKTSRPSDNDDDVENISFHSNLGSRHKRGGRAGEKKKKPPEQISRIMSSASGFKSGRGLGDDAEDRRVYLCGRALPCLRCPLFRVKSPSWSRVSSAIVRHAPCFWCSRRFETSATDRAILIRLNILCSVFAAVQVGAGMFLLIVQWQSKGGEEDATERLRSFVPNSWTGNIPLLGMFGVLLIIVMLLSLRVIRAMDMAGALKFMWALIWLLPIEILLVVGLFDYNNVTDVWVKHLWAVPSLEWFRDQFCYLGTSNTKCIVPILGGEDYDTEEDWCLASYNATDCQMIRDSAQEGMKNSVYAFMTACGAWGVMLVVLLSLTLTLLEGIITAPIVQASKQANIPFWLTLPIAGCFLGGSLLLFSPTSATGENSEDSVFWIGVAYFACGGAFFIAALLGWFISAFSVLNNKDKKRKQIVIHFFIATLALTFLTVAAIFSASLIYSASIVDLEIDDNTRGDIACSIDGSYNTCTRCDESVERCPEWTTEDLMAVGQAQLKQSAIMAAILSIYAVSALRFGFVLRKHLSRYQIDYV